MTVAVLTDSSACLPPSLVEEFGVVVVPITVAIEAREVPADELDRDELIKRLRGEHDVTTSAPSPGAFLAALEEHAGADGAVVLTVAANMSTTHQTASLAASQVDHPVRVVDTGTAAGGLGLVVLAAARVARDDADLDRVEAEARHAAERIRLVAAVGSLDHLARSGRVPRIAGRAGNALGVRPLFELKGGEPRLLMPSMSRDAAHDRLVAQWRESRPRGGAALDLSVLHADAPDEAASLLRAVEAEVTPRTKLVAEFDPALIVHTGPDVVGLAWWWDER